MGDMIGQRVSQSSLNPLQTGKEGCGSDQKVPGT